MPLINKKQAQLIAKHCKVVSNDKLRPHIRDIAVIPESGEVAIVATDGGRGHVVRVDGALGTDETVRVDLKKWKTYTQLITGPVDLLEFARQCAADVQHPFPPYQQVIDDEDGCKMREGQMARIQINGRYLADALACAPQHGAAVSRVYPPGDRLDPTHVFYEVEAMRFEAVVMPKQAECESH